MRRLEHCNIVKLKYFFYSSGDKVCFYKFYVIYISTQAENCGGILVYYFEESVRNFKEFQELPVQDSGLRFSSCLC